MAKVFAIPLQKPSNGRFQGVSTDFRAIGQVYRERFGGPFFPCEQLKPAHKCDQCGRIFDPNTNMSYGPDCSGACQY